MRSISKNEARSSCMVKALYHNDVKTKKAKSMMVRYACSDRRTKKRSIGILVYIFICAVAVSAVIISPDLALTGTAENILSANSHAALNVETVAGTSFMADKIAIVAVPLFILLAGYMAVSIGQMRSFFKSSDRT